MKQLDAYVSKFNALSSTSVESILEMGSLMLDAKTVLPAHDYQKFLNQVKYAEKSSSIRKWERIGQAKIRLLPLKDILPPTWSTIYKLSGLKPDQLSALIDSGTLSPSVTAKEIDAELNPVGQVKKSQVLKIEIVFDDFVDANQLNLLMLFIEQHPVFHNMTIKQSDGIKDLLATPNLKLAA